MNDVLQQAITAARSGKREEARTLLIALVEADEKNLDAWLWLSGVVDDPKDMQVCLLNVLDLDPTNQRAKQGLAWLEQKHGLTLPNPEPTASAPPSHVSSAGQPTTLLNTPQAALPAPQTASTASFGSPPRSLPAQGSPSYPATATAGFGLPSTLPPLQPLEPLPSEIKADGFLPDSTSSGGACPYCGTATELQMNHCPKCRKSLLFPASDNEPRSFATTMLGWLWYISGGLTLIGLVLAIGVFIWASRQAQSIPGAATDVQMTQNSIAIGSVLGTLVGVLLPFALGNGMLRRKAWAWIVTAIITAFNLLSTILSLIVGAFTLNEVSRQLELTGAPPETVNLFASISAAAQLCGFVITALYVTLVVVSYRDFFRPKQRFMSTHIEPADDRQHFNNGLNYRQRGMWYMAIREWEIAVAKSPRDPMYLHALGLAYAQLGEFMRARSALERALAASPNNQQIIDSQTSVEKLATGKQR
jgi:tetratricopeptide (TPR) repeat protein